LGDCSDAIFMTENHLPELSRRAREGQFLENFVCQPQKKSELGPRTVWARRPPAQPQCERLAGAARRSGRRGVAETPFSANGDFIAHGR